MGEQSWPRLHDNWADLQTTRSKTWTLNDKNDVILFQCLFFFFFHFIFFFFFWKCWINNQLQDSEKNEQNTPGQVKQAETSDGRYTHRQGRGQMFLGFPVNQLQTLSPTSKPHGGDVGIRRRKVLDQSHHGSSFNPRRVVKIRLLSLSLFVFSVFSLVYLHKQDEDASSLFQLSWNCT